MKENYMGKIILVTESGSDLTPDIAVKYGIRVVPMYVTFGEDTKEDGSFETEEIVEYYNKTGKVPKTSGSNVEDFQKMFDQIHEEEPDADILYIAYSAVTTVSYNSASVAKGEQEHIHLLDSKQVSGGLGASVIRMAKLIREHVEWDIHQAYEAAKELCEKTHFNFIPSNMDFLRAGGRVSNAVALCGNVLKIHPCINVEGGYLLAGKRYRGSLKKVIPELMKDFCEKYPINKKEIWLSFTPGFTEELKQHTRQIAEKLGFKEINWLPCKGVITSHGGPGALGITGFEDLSFVK